MHSMLINALHKHVQCYNALINTTMGTLFRTLVKMYMYTYIYDVGNLSYNIRTVRFTLNDFTLISGLLDPVSAIV
jgi:hypothetical protein